MKSLIAFIFFTLIHFSINAQSVIGKWTTIDDETGKPRSVVELYMKNGKLYGKVIRLIREPSEEQDPYCKKCTDDRKDQRIIGMEIIRDLVQDDDEWEDGTICDPKKGEVYECGLWLSDSDSNKLEVRGYWGIFYRTQTWVRATE